MLTKSFGTGLVVRRKFCAAFAGAIATSAFFFFSPTASAIGFAQNFSFDGVLVNESTGVPMAGPVALRFQIYDPGGTCLLFEEEHPSVALQADGSFNIKVGSGTRASAGTDGGLILNQIFQNIQTVRNSASPNCSPGFTPAAGDGRRLRVTVNATTLAPDYSLSPMPMATVAETLQGRGVTDFVSTTSASSLVGPLTLANQGEVRFASASANYVSLRAPATVPAPVIFYLPPTDGANGECLTTNGAGQFVWAACGGGGPTGVTAGTYPKVTVDSDGRVLAGLALTNADLAPIAFMGDVSGSVNTMSVDRIRGYAVSATAPANGMMLQYNSGLMQWEPANFPDFSGGGAMGGALNITAGGLSVAAGGVTVGAGGLNVTAGSALFPMGSAAAPSLQVGSAGYGLFNNGSSLGFSAAGSERMRITNSGNVGIGTTTPTQPLDVVGNVSVTGTIFVDRVESPAVSSSSSPAFAMYDGMSGLYHDGARMGLASGGVDRLSINTGNGRVGIGIATPAATLDVMGTARLQKYATAPATCTAGIDGVIAMTSTYTLCVCNSTTWVRTGDGTTACTW